jgi:uncharacterized lipoprotein NlpE involved in copper resistance
MRKQIKLLIAATLLLVGCNNAKPPKADMVVSI